MLVLSFVFILDLKLLWALINFYNLPSIPKFIRLPVNKHEGVHQTFRGFLRYMLETRDFILLSRVKIKIECFLTSQMNTFVSQWHIIKIANKRIIYKWLTHLILLVTLTWRSQFSCKAEALDRGDGRTEVLEAVSLILIVQNWWLRSGVFRTFDWLKRFDGKRIRWHDSPSPLPRGSPYSSASSLPLKRLRCCWGKVSGFRFFPLPFYLTFPLIFSSPLKWVLPPSACFSF